MSKRLSVGIDLGTSNGCVFYQKWRDICENLSLEGSSSLVPSVVSYGNEPPVVGSAAQKQLDNKIRGIGNKEYTIVRNSKRVLGIKYRKDLIAIRERLCFANTEEGDDDYVEFVSDDKKKRFTPVDVAADILKFLHQAVKERGGDEVASLVVTVPARFNYRQILLTYDAIKRAFDDKTKVLLIDEPTAAAVASNVLLQERDTTFVVFDLGGGTFDLSVLKYSNSSIQCLTTSGSDSIGGVLFDEKLREYIQTQDSWKEFQNTHPSRRELYNEALLRQCIDAKVQLSSAVKATIVVGDNGFFFEIYRAKFENLIADVVNNAIDIMNEAILKVNLNRHEINQVILVGGSTQVPLVQKMIKEYFGRDIVMHTLDPWCCVAQGACMISHAWEQSDFNESEIKINGKRFALDKDLDGVINSEYFLHPNVLPEPLSVSSSTVAIDKRPVSISMSVPPFSGDKRPESVVISSSNLTVDKRPESVLLPNSLFSLEGIPTSVRFTETVLQQLKNLCGA